jgi:hypothetical protein
MKPAKSQPKPGIALIVFSAFVLLCPPPVRALDPSLDITQYAHLAWTFRNGFGTGQSTQSLRRLAVTSGWVPRLV